MWAVVCPGLELLRVRGQRQGVEGWIGVFYWCLIGLDHALDHGKELFYLTNEYKRLWRIACCQGTKLLCSPLFLSPLLMVMYARSWWVPRTSVFPKLESWIVIERTLMWASWTRPKMNTAISFCSGWNPYKWWVLCPASSSFYWSHRWGCQSSCWNLNGSHMWGHL